MTFETFERGYFRSPGRGGFFSKKRRRNFSRSRMTLRVGAIEKSMFVVSQKNFLEPCDLKKFLSLVKVQGISFLRVSEWQNLEISKSKFPKNVQIFFLKIVSDSFYMHSISAGVFLTSNSPFKVLSRQPKTT